ncbi:MAG TPA: apolipoprotein N-acyltransferase [Candidatus Sulfotelmatobacter sp.]|nr:apolipoprotein N-acyltransferase [Candidatus Sulfotelmatobacter sp.]
MSVALDRAAANPGRSGVVVRCAMRLAGLAGWRRAAAAVLLGAAGAGALPPVDAVPLLALAFTGLVWLVDGAPRLRSAFWIGWWFGLGFFTAGLYWIAAALFVDIARFWWLLPFAVLGVPAFFGLFSGAVTAACWIAGARGLGRPLMLATAWTAAEFARGHVLTGFPWNLVGSAWTVVGPVLQAVSVIGMYGLSWVTVVLAALPALLAVPADPGVAGGWHTPRRAVPMLGVGLAALAALAALGALRLAAAPSPGASDAVVPGVRLRLVQPDIEQSLKWRDNERIAIFRRLLSLSATPSEHPPTAIIWPEAATPFLFERSPEARAAAAAMLPPDALLLTGTPRATRTPDGGTAYWNGMIALDHADTVRGSYDKFHLVPFGEYVPLSHILPLAALAPGGGGGFSAGPGPRTLHLPGLPPVSPLICYEIIFPGQVIDPADRPAWIVNLTNDAWYGITSGPYQHFASAIARAVEQGLPVVRAAQTGISGVIDPYGRVIARLGLGQRGVLDAPLPQALPEATIYQRFGGPILAILLLVGLAGGVWSRRR